MRYGVSDLCPLLRGLWKDLINHLILHEGLRLLFRIGLLLCQHVKLNRRLWLYTIAWWLSLLLIDVKKVSAFNDNFALREDLLLLNCLFQVRVWALSGRQCVLNSLSLYIFLSWVLVLLSIRVDNFKSDMLCMLLSRWVFRSLVQVLMDNFSVLLHNAKLLRRHWTLWVHEFGKQLLTDLGGPLKLTLLLLLHLRYNLLEFVLEALITVLFSLISWLRLNRAGTPVTLVLIIGLLVPVSWLGSLRALAHRRLMASVSGSSSNGGEI